MAASFILEAPKMRGEFPVVYIIQSRKEKRQENMARNDKKDLDISETICKNSNKHKMKGNIRIDMIYGISYDDSIK